MLDEEYKFGPESPEISELFGDNFLKLNKYFIQEFGLINAVVLCNLKEKDLYFRHFKGSNGSFFLDKKSQEKELNLSPHLLREAIKNLVELNLIKVERKGIPPRYWYEINYNEIKKAIDLYRSKISTFKGENNGPINNKIKGNKIKPGLKDFGDAASQPSPDSDLETKDFDLEVENKPSINSNENPPKQTKKKTSKSTKKQISQIDRIKAERILSKFNDCLKIFKQKTKQPPTDGWKPLDQNIRVIVDRLIDGYVYKDFIKIIETKIHDPWFIERPALYVPTTLFGADKFEKYRHEDPTQYKKQSSTNKPSNGSGYTGTRKYKEAKVVKNVFTPWED